MMESRWFVINCKHRNNFVIWGKSRRRHVSFTISKTTRIFLSLYVLQVCYLLSLCQTSLNFEHHSWISFPVQTPTSALSNIYCTANINYLIVVIVDVIKYWFMFTDISIFVFLQLSIDKNSLKRWKCNVYLNLK